MKIVGHIFSLLILLTLTTSCSKPAKTEQSSGVMTPSADNRTTDQRAPGPVQKTDTCDPVLALWDGGIYLLGVKPSVLFAAWAEGTVVRFVDGRLKIGNVSRETVSKLLSDIEKAGIRHPPVAGGIVHPDGPLKRLSVMIDGEATQLSYDGSTSFNDTTPDASPSRLQLEAFAKMWREMEDAIAKVKPAEMTDVTADLGLVYPAR